MVFKSNPAMMSNVYISVIIIVTWYFLEQEEIFSVVYRLLTWNRAIGTKFIH